MKKIVFIYGNFNILHPGHIRIFKFAKEFKRKLVVGVIGDKIATKDIVVDQQTRLESVESIGIVDEAFIIHKPILEIIKKLKPEIIVKGKEFEFQINPEVDILNSYGGKLFFGSGDFSFTSLENNRRKFNNDLINFPKNFFNKYEIKKEKLLSIINQFKNKRVCVIGETIIDHYITCDPLGLSQEEPVLVVKPIEENQYLGGASIVAAHAASLMAKSHLISIVGNDNEKKFITKELTKQNVIHKLLVDVSRPTIVKVRYRSKNKTLFKVSKLHQDNISLKLQNLLLVKLKKLLSDIDVLIFSDFNYGVLPEPLVEKIIKLCKSKNIFLVADSQSSSQIGELGKYVGCDLITPTEYEARLFLRNKDDGLAYLANSLMEKLKCKNTFLKLGEDGLLILTLTKNKPTTDQLKALSKLPIDVAGAGDSLLISTALAFSAGANVWEAALIGSIAAAIQVGREGNIPLKINDFSEVLES